MALLLAHENITNGFYPGNDKQLLVANVLFKLGGSAAVMSTRHAALPYRVVHGSPACDLAGNVQRRSTLPAICGNSSAVNQQLLSRLQSLAVNTLGMFTA